MNIVSAIESILFVASKPLPVKKIAKALDVSIEEVEEGIIELKEKFHPDTSGIVVLESGELVQFATHPTYESVVDGFVKKEVTDELTKAQLETLTIIAYCGPITRPELEETRGVNCSVILRNLLMRGLIQEEQAPDAIAASYVLSPQALAHIGITSVEELPQYEELRNHPHITQEQTEQAA